MVLTCVLKYVNYLRHGCMFALSYFVSFSSVLFACICFVVILFLFDSNCVKRSSETLISRKSLYR